MRAIDMFHFSTTSQKNTQKSKVNALIKNALKTMRITAENLLLQPSSMNSRSLSPQARLEPAGRRSRLSRSLTFWESLRRELLGKTTRCRRRERVRDRTNSRLPAPKRAPSRRKDARRLRRRSRRNNECVQLLYFPCTR